MTDGNVEVLELPDTSQDWARLDGGAAFHLIERHADDWDEAARMMEAWRVARTDALAKRHENG